MMKSWSTHLIWACVALLAAVWGRWGLDRSDPVRPPPGKANEPHLAGPQASPSASPPRLLPDPVPQGPRASPESSVIWIQTSGASVPFEDLRRWIKSDQGQELSNAYKILQTMPAGELKRELYLDLLKSKDPNLRRDALQNLKGGPHPEADSFFQDVLKSDPSPQVRSTAVWILGRPGGEANIGCLLQAFRDEDLAVRVAAASCLNRLGQPGPLSEILPQLESSLNDPDAAARRTAVMNLSNLGSPVVIPLLTRALADTSSDVRCSAIWGLYAVGGDQHPEIIIPLLEAAFQDSNEKVSEAAKDFLMRLKPAPGK